MSYVDYVSITLLTFRIHYFISNNETIYNNTFSEICGLEIKVSRKLIEKKMKKIAYEI